MDDGDQEIEIPFAEEADDADIEFFSPSSDPSRSLQVTRQAFEASEVYAELYSDAEGQSESVAPPWRRFGIKVLVVILAFVFLTWLLERVAEDWLTNLAARLMQLIGLPGLFVIVFLADGVPQPFTYVPLIFLAVKGSIGKPIVFVVCALASYSAALVGYAVGAQVRRLQRGEACFRKLSEEYPYVPEMMKRRGACGVGIAALLPIPLAMATWTAGSFHISFPPFLLAAMCRMPKIAIFVVLSGSPKTETS